MKISVSAIIDYLCDNKSIKLLNKSEETSERIEFFSFEEESNHTLCIATKPVKGPACYVNCDFPLQENQFCIETKLSKNQLFQYLLQFYMRESTIGERFLQLIHQNASLDELIEYIHGYLNNPIILYDNHFHVLAYTKSDMIDHHLWKDIVENGGVDELREPLPDTFFDFASKVEGNIEKPERIESKDLLSPFINTFILYKGKCIGILCMAEYHHKVSEIELGRIEFFSKLLSFELQKSLQINSDTMQEQVLTDLLENRIYTTTRKVQHFLSKSNRYQLIQLSTEESEFLLENIKKQILYVTNKIVCCNYNQCLYILQTEENRVLLGQIIHELTEGYNIKIAVSDEFKDITQCSKMLHQLDFIREHCTGKVIEFKQVRTEYLFSFVSATDVIAPELFLIKKQDEIYNGSLLTTLRVYLENEQEKQLTSKQLNIHRSTLLYRLDKISEIASIDYNDHKQILSLQIGLAYLDYLEKK